MKSVLSFLLALCCVSAYAAPGNDYPATVHVKTSHLTRDGGQLYQRLDVVIDGHEYELAGTPLSSSIFESALLVPAITPLG